MASLEDLKKHQNLGPTVPVTPHYTDYTQSLEKNTAPGGAITTPTGFLEFKPRDSATQARYDAMQDQWEGVKPSEAAIAKGTYLPDYAADAKERGEKNKTIPKLDMSGDTPPKPKSWWFLS
jgi:hypothetical protein